MNITTITLIEGGEFDYANPDASTITLHDVAHALARVPRYVGQAAGDYSVAAHAIVVAALVGSWYDEPRLALAALHHDDVEAFTGDWPTPLKRYLETCGLDYKRALERPIEAALCHQLDLVMDDLHAGVIRDADAAALAIEYPLLKPNAPEAHAGDLPEIDSEMREKYEPFVIELGNADCGNVEATYMALDRKLREYNAA